MADKERLVVLMVKKFSPEILLEIVVQTIVQLPEKLPASPMHGEVVELRDCHLV
jgi:hypothetical protein